VVAMDRSRSVAILAQDTLKADSDGCG